MGLECLVKTHQQHLYDNEGRDEDVYETKSPATCVLGPWSVCVARERVCVYERKSIKERASFHFSLHKNRPALFLEKQQESSLKGATTKAAALIISGKKTSKESFQCFKAMLLNKRA